MTDGRLLLYETQCCLWQKIAIAKDCLLTDQEQDCTRITWLFGRSFGCNHAENGLIHRKMVVDCPLVITSKVKPFFRPDNKTRKEK